MAWISFEKDTLEYLANMFINRFFTRFHGEGKSAAIQKLLFFGPNGVSLILS